MFIIPRSSLKTAYPSISALPSLPCFVGWLGARACSVIAESQLALKLTPSMPRNRPTASSSCACGGKDRNVDDGLHNCPRPVLDFSPADDAWLVRRAGKDNLSGHPLPSDADTWYKMMRSVSTLFAIRSTDTRRENAAHPILFALLVK